MKMKKINDNIFKIESLWVLILIILFIIHIHLNFDEYIKRVLKSVGSTGKGMAQMYVLKQVYYSYGKAGVFIFFYLLASRILYVCVKDLKKYFRETKEYSIYYKNAVPDEAYLNIYNIETAGYKELNKLSSEQLTMIIHTIYARNSFRFEDENLKDYYMKYDWYKYLLEEFKEPQKLSSEEESRIKIIEELIKNKEKNYKS
jgi:hypothetical protein